MKYYTLSVYTDNDVGLDQDFPSMYNFKTFNSNRIIYILETIRDHSVQINGKEHFKDWIRKCNLAIKQLKRNDDEFIYGGNSYIKFKSTIVPDVWDD